MIAGQVVDTGARDEPGVEVEVDDASAGHREGPDHVLRRNHHLRRVARERRGRQVSVEQEVEVLVGRHPRHHVVSRGVADDLAGVAMGDARRELLQGEVDEAGLRTTGPRRLAPGDLGHPGPLEAYGIDRAGDGQVVANHDGVTALLGCPPPGPHPPGLVGAEHPLNVAEVVREVVLGEQVHEQGARYGRTERGTGEVGVALVPRISGHEVAAPAVGDQLVGEPLFRRR